VVLALTWITRLQFGDAFFKRPNILSFDMRPRSRLSGKTLIARL
jgi:hypothetical protein